MIAPGKVSVVGVKFDRSMMNTCGSRVRRGGVKVAVRLPPVNTDSCPLSCQSRQRGSSAHLERGLVVITAVSRSALALAPGHHSLADGHRTAPRPVRAE